MAHVVAQFASGRDARGPVHDQRRGDAALVDPDLVPAERRVARAGPARTQAQERPPRTRVGAPRSWPSPRTSIVGVRAVVGQEEDHRVVERVHGPQLFEHAADLAVHPVDHRRVDRHLGRLEPSAARRSVRSTRPACSISPGPTVVQQLRLEVARRAASVSSGRPGRS